MHEIGYVAVTQCILDSYLDGGNRKKETGVFP